MTDHEQSQLTSLEPHIVSLGSHPGIIQSMLDYAYCIGTKEPNIAAIIGSGRKQERYFWGSAEVIIRVYKDFDALPEKIKQMTNTLLIVQSARRVLAGFNAAASTLPELKFVNIFAESVPELHSLQMASLANEKNIIVAGPSSVGLLVPGTLKLGAIGGTQYAQLMEAKIFQPGHTAVISTSGGMVNELIHLVTGNGLGVSFALALGGDRFPVTSPKDAFLIAEHDPSTKQIVYFGELGGNDEYVLTDLIQQGKISKPVVAYIAGTVADLFDEPPQFGHAKAMAENQNESAAAKKSALRSVGVTVCDVFGDLGDTIKKDMEPIVMDETHREIEPRSKAHIISRISGDVDGDVHILNKDLLSLIDGTNLAGLYISLLLGHEVTSERLIAFTDYILKLLADHGPYVSGAINTIVAARAGKDLASSLSAGLLTIGPRFGGAVNAAAQIWLDGVTTATPAKAYIEGYTKNNGILSGIGHKKYRIDLPDPRVRALTEKFSENSNGSIYFTFAKQIEAITTTKKGNLILNVDGAIAAIMLDMLASELHYTPEKLQELVDIEFFNALFILSRSAGFIAHYLDQRRNDEGLLRFSEADITYIP